MKRFFSYLSVLMVLFFISCGDSPKKRDVYFEKEEDFNGFVVFVTDAYEFRTYDLSSYSFIASTNVHNPRGFFIYRDTVFFHNSNLYKYSFEANEVEKVLELHSATLAVILTNGGVFSINRDGMLYNDQWIVEDTIIDYSESYRNIWLLTPHKVMSIDKKERTEKIKELDNPITFCVSPYGLRTYVAFSGRIDVYQEKDFILSKSIKIDDTPVELVATPAGNKIYVVTTRGLYVVDRATYSIDKIASLVTEPILIRLSRDGSYGTVACLDRLLIFDAGTDELLKEINISCIDVETSPLDSKIYALTDGGIAVIRSDSLVVESIVDIKGEDIFIPTIRFKMKKENEEKYFPTDVDTTVRLFTIQVSSSKNKRSAEQLIERLLTAGYPAYLVGSDGWFKVRVGAFKQKDYALLISEKVDEVIKEKSWVLESEIHLSEIPSPLIRDLSGNGYMEEACMRDGKDIVIFEIRNGMYNVIHTITGYLEKYTGYPSFYDIDGDGNLEIVTPTLQGGLYSVVRYRNGEWIEEMKRYE